MRYPWYSFFAILFLLILFPFQKDLGGRTLDSGAVDSAFQYLRNTQDKFHNTFDVYTDEDAAGNHFTLSGWMTQLGYDPSAQLEVKTDWLRAPVSGTTCIKITNTYSTGHAPWAGIYWLYPDGNWGLIPDAGYDLSGADSIVFYAKGENGGETVQFFALGVGGLYGDSSPRWPPTIQSYKTLDTAWTRYCIDLSGKDLSYVIGGFAFVVEPSRNKSQDITFYTDEIKYYLNPDAQESRLEEPRFLLSYSASSDTTDYKEDFAIRNIALTEDNAKAMLALIDASDTLSSDWDRAKHIGDAFLLARANDRFFIDGRLRNGYMAGDVLDHYTGFVRIPGWWNPDSAQYFEDRCIGGTSTGSIAWVIIALLEYHKWRLEPRYLAVADSLGRWIRARYDSLTGDGDIVVVSRGSRKIK